MKLYSLLFTLTLTCSSVFATDVTIPNSFSSGSATNAAEMNANFSAVKAAVDDNDSRISALESSSAVTASEFMGFSSGTALGSDGYLTMGNLCHTSFSGSHMCSTIEFAGAKMNGVSVIGSAWITPIINEPGVSATGNDTYFGKNCFGWSDTGNIAGGFYGQIITSDGSISKSSCDVTTNKVACCK